MSQPLVSHRAIEIHGEVPGGQLSRILREIADWYDRPDNDEPPEILRDDRLLHAFVPWSQSRRALERAWHELSGSRNLGSRATIVREIDTLVAAEAQAWSAVRAALLAELNPT